MRTRCRGPGEHITGGAYVYRGCLAIYRGAPRLAASLDSAGHAAALVCLASRVFVLHPLPPQCRFQHVFQWIYRPVYLHSLPLIFSSTDNTN